MFTRTQLFGAPMQIQARIMSICAGGIDVPRAGIWLPEHIPTPVSLLIR